jgi:hypothetical protein
MSSQLRTLPRFNGERSKYAVYRMQFHAFARVHKFEKALLPDGEDDLPDREDGDLDESDPDDAVQIAALKRNADALQWFALSFETNQLVELITATYTEEFPNGLAHVVQSRLDKKYRPKDAAALVRMQNSLKELGYNNNDDPSVFFGKIANIKAQYGGDGVSKAELIATVLGKLPIEFVSTLMAEQLRLGDKFGMTNIEEFLESVHSCNKQKMKSKKKVDDDDDDGGGGEEHVLACFFCHDEGHKIAECPKRCKHKCKVCGVRGHTEDRCWESPSNKQRRPKGWKSKKKKNYQSSSSSESSSDDSSSSNSSMERNRKKKKKSKKKTKGKKKEVGAACYDEDSDDNNLVI